MYASVLTAQFGLNTQWCVEVQLTADWFIIEAVGRHIRYIYIDSCFSLPISLSWIYTVCQLQYTQCVWDCVRIYMCVGYQVEGLLLSWYEFGSYFFRIKAQRPVMLHNKYIKAQPLLAPCITRQRIGNGKTQLAVFLHKFEGVNGKMLFGQWK